MPFDEYDKRVIKESKIDATKKTKWEKKGNGVYTPSGEQVANLEATTHRIDSSPNIGVYWQKIPFNTNELINVDNSVANQVIEEVKIFCNSKDKYERMGDLYKRGWLFYGPAGGGKTSICNLILKYIFSIGGCAVQLTKPQLFNEGIRIFREKEPDRLLVVQMEDVESFLEEYSESEILNILDGSDQTSNVIFLATTNYPDILEDRIIDRPSRFDRVIEVKSPGDEIRKKYIEHLFTKFFGSTKKQPVSFWTSKSKKLTMAHIKELFTLVHVVGKPFDEAFAQIEEMGKEHKPSKKRRRRKKKVGFSDEEED